jgi:hypothetical protein
MTSSLNIYFQIDLQIYLIVPAKPTAHLIEESNTSLKYQPTDKSNVRWKHDLGFMKSVNSTDYLLPQHNIS